MIWAIIPIPWPWLVGGGSLWLLRKLFKWFQTDSHRDFIILMGPILSGKSELRDAYGRKPFKEKRPDTTEWTVPDKIDDKGSKLCIAVPDFSGAINDTKRNCSDIIAAIEESRPEYILTQLVFDATKLQGREVDDRKIADDVQFYLNMLIKHIENLPSDSHAAKVFQRGRWRLDIVGTHRDKLRATPNTDQLLDIVQYSDRMRLVRQRVALLDLSTPKGRGQALGHLVETLQAIHGD